MLLNDRFNQLDSLLTRFKHLWKPQPFKSRNCDWRYHYPHLAEKLLNLRDTEVYEFTRSDHALIPFLIEMIPALSDLPSLINLPTTTKHPIEITNRHLSWSIDGRKFEQILAFTESINDFHLPILEWCGGKGHLGRLLGAHRQIDVSTYEWNALLCESGAALAQRARVQQTFHNIDVLQNESPISSQTHAVALHACGELHRHLIRQCLANTLSAIEIAPCCYYHHAPETYSALHTGDAQLTLDKSDLRLAVTNTMTASAREVHQRDKEMAWKLGFLALYRNVTDSDEYRALKSIPKKWLQNDFETFCRNLSQRENVALMNHIDWPAYEDIGWREQGEVMRLSLVRLGFRRAIEMWIVTDLALLLEQNGYQVELGLFCSDTLTPRNILISAQRQ